MAFRLDRLGTWTAERELTVEAGRLRAYAAATNDPILQHAVGELAPPVFAVVPTWGAMGEAIVAVTPEWALAHGLHGEQDIHIHRPIRPGMVLRSRAAPVGVQVKPTGTTVVVRGETRAEDGALVTEQWFVSFFRGVSDGDGAGVAAPDHRLPAVARGTEPVAVVRQRFDDDQTFRYRDASGDDVAIHYDEDAAKAVGLPGIIIHGLCTMAFTSWGAITELAGGDPTRLKRLAVRFSKPLFPGEEITTRFFAAGVRDGRSVFAYETVNGAGELVITDGRVEVA